MNSQAPSHLTGDGIKLVSPDDGISHAEEIFLFIPAENNQQGFYLYGMLWVWGFILCKPHQNFLSFQWKQEQGCIQVFWNWLYIF